MENAQKKAQLRINLRTEREGLTETDRHDKDAHIADRLKELPAFQTACTILFYISAKGEVDTHRLIQAHLHDKIILIPKIEREELKIHHLKNWNDLTEGAYGIPTLKKENETPYNGLIDLIIVPGLGFDRHGHRLGYGKGYYDRLLKKHHSPTLGLAYDLQILNELPNEPHDIALHTILTETQIINPAP